MVPSVPSPGNHEMAKVDETTRRLTHHWRPQFTLPENGVQGIEETNYTFVYQGVRIVVMNSMEKVEEQGAWLDALLNDNKERWVICTFHFPIFSTGKNRDNESLRKIWNPCWTSTKWISSFRVTITLTAEPVWKLLWQQPISRLA